MYRRLPHVGYARGLHTALVAMHVRVTAGNLHREGGPAMPDGRDNRGRWRKGKSGNFAGRPRGSRNRWRRADPARAILWKASEWRLHFARTMTAAQGRPDERAGAAYAACQRLWRAHHPPRAQRGMCPQIGLSLSPPHLSFYAAPPPLGNMVL